MVTPAPSPMRTGSGRCAASVVAALRVALRAPTTGGLGTTRLLRGSDARPQLPPGHFRPRWAACRMAAGVDGPSRSGPGPRRRSRLARAAAAAGQLLRRCPVSSGAAGRRVLSGGQSRPRGPSRPEPQLRQAGGDPPPGDLDRRPPRRSQRAPWAPPSRLPLHATPGPRTGRRCAPLGPGSADRVKRAERAAIEQGSARSPPLPVPLNAALRIASAPRPRLACGTRLSPLRCTLAENTTCTRTSPPSDGSQPAGSSS